MEILYTPEFKRSLKKLSRRYRSIKLDLKSLLTALEEGETPGDLLQNVACTAYKVRIANRDSRKGKSGGYRVIYYLKMDNKRVLVTLYSKGDQEDMSPGEIMRIVSKYGGQLI